MDSGKSLIFIRDFEQRIERAPLDFAQEQFLREFLSDLATDCPIAVLTRIARCVLDIRRDELRIAGQQN